MEYMNYKLKNEVLDDYGFKNPVMEGASMKVKVERSLKIEDGKHYGEITGIQYKNEPYSYVDIEIKEENTGIKLRCGVPLNLTENTTLGLIMTNFGARLSIGEDLEIDDWIRGNVEFVTTTDGKFSRVVPSSLKPRK